MADAARLTIRSDFPRPAAEHVAAFRAKPTGHVVDSQGRQGALPHWIRPVTKISDFVGSALTVKTRPVDNLAPYAALRFARPGDVLVVTADADDSASIMGDILIGMARNAGIVAIVTDALVRDIAGIEAVGIPVFAQGLSPNSPMKDGPGTVGLPIHIGGVIVQPGDLVLGDQDGVVIVPREQIAPTLAGLETVAEKEATMERLVSEGAAEPAWLDAVLTSDRVRRLG